MQKIGLFCSTIFHYYIYENILKLLPNQYIFISPVLDTLANEDELTDFINQKGYKLVSEDHIINGQIDIDILLSPYWRPSFELFPIEIKMVRLMYGYAKDNWNYDEWNGNYDLVFSYGLYAQKKLARFNNSIAVGNPRMIGFKDSLESKGIFDINNRSLRRFIQPNKKTILIAPTWGPLSSSSLLIPYLDGLSNNYNLLLKVHHQLVLQNDIKVKSLLNEFKLFYCDEKVDIFSLIRHADIVISDYSGAIFDGILCGKRTVLINNEQQRNLSSLEGLMRKQLKVLRTKSQACFLEDIKDVFSNDRYESMIKDIRQELYTNVEQPQIIVYKIQEALTKLGNRSKKKLECNKRDELLQEFKSTKRFIICGCGEYGQSLMYFLLHHQRQIVCFIDNKNQKPLLDNIPILNEEEFIQFKLDECQDVTFLIATQSGENYFKELLNKKNVENSRIMSL